MNDVPAPTSSKTALPRAAAVYIGVLAVAGTLAVVAELTMAGASAGRLNEPSVAMLVLIGAASVVFPLRFHHGGAVQGFNVTIGAHLALLVLLPDEVAVLGAVLVAAAGYATATHSVVKTLFNAGQAALWASAAMLAGRLVLGADIGGDVLAPRSFLALAVAAAIAALVNELLTNELFHHLGGESRTELFRGVIGAVTGVTIGGNFIVALLLTVLAERSATAVVLSIPMFVGLLLGYRGFVADREQARQSQLLHETSSKLLDGALDDEALEQAVDGLRELFGADRVILAAGDQALTGDLQLIADDVRRTGATVVRTEVPAVLAAPVTLDGRVVGALIAQGRHGMSDWDAADLALVAIVAGEIAATLRTRQLFGQVEREREQLAEETNKLSDILRTASDGIILLDEHGTIQACNPAMAAIVGIEVGAALGRGWHEVLQLHDGDEVIIGSDDGSPMAEALAGRQRLEAANLSLLRSDGDTRRLRCSAAPVASSDGGTARGVVLVGVDLTREREIDELRSDFISTVSHELRTPLTPLSGFLAVLKEHGVTLSHERRTMMVGAMEKQVDRLQDLIGDLLLVAEIERGLTRIHHEVVDVRRSITEVLEVEAASPEVRQRLDLDLAPAFAMADVAAVRRIIRALISNGIKHTEGCVNITLSSSDASVEVVVSDDGAGIAGWAHDAIFEPFRRLGNHLHRPQGPGLGLAVARSLAESLGGSLHVADAPGGGARFVLTLPAAGVEDAPRRTRRIHTGY